MPGHLTSKKKKNEFTNGEYVCHGERKQKVLWRFPKQRTGASHFGRLKKTNKKREREKTPYPQIGGWIEGAYVIGGLWLICLESGMELPTF